MWSHLRLSSWVWNLYSMLSAHILFFYEFTRFVCSLSPCPLVHSSRCTVVTSRGELVECSATENNDLFWALHGGGIISLCYDRISSNSNPRGKFWGCHHFSLSIYINTTTYLCDHSAGIPCFSLG